MQFDFSKPQRQSAAGIVIMATHAIQLTARIFFIPIILFVVKAQVDALIYMLIGVATIICFSLIYAYFYYRKFTFFLNDQRQEFVLNKGVFVRTNLTIPLEKIQQVNINQNILQKLIGVYSVHLDTAGTSAKEVKIKAVKKEVAYSLKQRLLNEKAKTIAVVEPIGETTTPQETGANLAQSSILKINASTLFKVGLTSNYGSSLAVLTTFAYAVFHNAKEFLKAFDKDNGQVENFISRGFNLASIGILVALLLAILLGTNIIRTFIKYFNFQIVKNQQSLLISAGLFTTKDTLLSPKKVQITAYNQNYFQKKMRLFNLELRQADAGKPANNGETKNNNLAVPGCHPDEKNAIIKMILGEVPQNGKVFDPNWRFINLPIVFQAVLPFVVFIAFYLFVEEVQPYLFLAVGYLFVSALMIYISYKRHQITVTGDFIVKRSGIWDITHEIIEPHKIQAITTFQYPWHKSVDVGHVDLHTAAGLISFRFGNYTDIKQLVNLWLYQIETSGEDWM